MGNDEGMKDTSRKTIGNMNGLWAILLKFFLGFQPFVVLFLIWITTSLFDVKSTQEKTVLPVIKGGHYLSPEAIMAAHLQMELNWKKEMDALRDRIALQIESQKLELQSMRTLIDTWRIERGSRTEKLNEGNNERR